MIALRTKALRALAVVALLVVAVPALPGSDGAARAASPTADLDEHFLTTRPDLGPTWVVDLAGMSQGELMLIRSLQGQVNSTVARLYVTDPGRPGNEVLLDSYVDRGLVTIAGHLDLDGALAKFAPEVTGYVVADTSEPWTFGVGATMAAAEGSIVLTPELAALAQSHGLTELDDLRGRWADRATAFTESMATYRSQLDYPGVSVLKPVDTGWDFAIQQDMPVVFTRPSHSDWSTVASLVTSSEPGHAIYGYLSDGETEENQAISELAEHGHFLIPTNSTHNLSFHVAVGADQPLTKAPAPDLDSVEACNPEDLNVVIGLTDGDNLAMALNQYHFDGYWPSANRGQIPLGWSIGPQLGVLAPAVWNEFAATATPKDELVGMIGIGYTAPALLPDPTPFYEDSFALMAAMGMPTFWSLAGGLETPTSPNWADVEAAAAAAGTPTGLLVGYGSATGVGTAYRSPGGLPAFTAGTSYFDWSDDLVDQIEALLAMPPEDRPLVNFFAASSWAHSVDSLTSHLLPFEEQGVRFLTPAEAAECMPPAPTGPIEAGPGECLPTDTPTPSGLSLISDLATGEIENVPTPISPDVSLTATPTVPSGGVIDYDAQIGFDLDALANEVLEERARPIVGAGGYGDAVTNSTWVELDFSELTLRFALPDGVQAAGTPSVTGPANAAWSADGRFLEVTLDPASVDSRSATPDIDVSVAFTGSADPQTQDTDVQALPGPTTFDLALTVGVLLAGTPLTGTVTAPWACVAATGPIATTTVLAATDSTSTTTTVPGGTAPPSTAPPSTEPGSPTTSVPTGPTSTAPTSTSEPGAPTTAVRPTTTGDQPGSTSQVPASTTGPGSGSLPPAPAAQAVAARPHYTG